MGNQNIDDRLQQRAISDAASHYHASVFCSVQGNAPLTSLCPSVLQLPLISSLSLANMAPRFLKVFTFLEFLTLLQLT